MSNLCIEAVVNVAEALVQPSSGSKIIMPLANYQLWREYMGEINFSQSFKKVRRANSSIVKSRAKVWFLKTCLLLNVRPVTLRSRVRDPAAHQPGYSAERAEAWSKAQHAAGGRLVQEALDREKLRLVELLQKGNDEWNHARTKVGERQWPILVSRVEELDNSDTKVRRREQGVRLVGLRREAGRGIPAWLNRSAGSLLEGTATILAGEVGGNGPITSTPARHSTSWHASNESRVNIVNLEESEEDSIAATSSRDQGEGGRRKRRSRGRVRFRCKARQRAQREKPKPPDLFFNYTDIPLTESMKQVLNLGPNFVPDRPKVNPIDISVGNLRMRRGMEWDAYFQLKEREEGQEEEEGAEEGEREIRVLEDPEVKTNRPRKWKKPAALSEFESANLLNLTSASNLAKIRPNFPPLLQAAVKDMNTRSQQREWVIKPTDKNGGLALMPFEAYDAAMKEKLGQTFKDENGNDQLKYPPATKQQLAEEWRLLKTLVGEGVREGFVGEKDGAVAMPREPTSARLYGNPKVHKPTRADIGIPPLREIVSCAGSNSEGLGKLVDSHTRPVDEACSSFLQDTPHLLRLIEDLNREGPQPAGTFIFSLDVVALYPSVPTSKGPGVLKNRLLKAGKSEKLVDWLTRSTQALLESNTFEYDSQLFTQKDGAGIGQPQACSYAGIYMAEVEEEGLRRYRRRGGAGGSIAAGKGRKWKKRDRAEVDWWHRFRDDCLGLFRGTQADFKIFLETMNGVDPAIQFTSEINFERNTVNFLDVQITINEQGYLTTDLYEKPNTLNQLLKPTSAHPSSVTRGSVYSLAIRLRRICCTDELFELRVGQLKQKLLERGYSMTVVEAGIRRAREVPRSEALKKAERRKDQEEDGRQHRLIVEFDRRSSPALGQILKNNYEAACNRDARFRALFRKAPKPTFRKGTNVKQLLVKAKLPRVRPVNTRAGVRENRRGVTRCNKGTGRNQCGGCVYLTRSPREVVKEVKMNSTGEVVKIEDKMNCKTRGCIYVLQSDRDPRQYGGQTGATIETRAKQHAYDIDSKLDKAVPRHFEATGSGKENLRVIPVMKVRSNNPWVRLHVERMFINKYNLVDQGINESL